MFGSLRKDRVIHIYDAFSLSGQVEKNCCPILDGLKINLNFVSARLIESLLFSLDLLASLISVDFPLLTSSFFLAFFSSLDSFFSTTVCLPPFLSPLASEALAGPGDGFPFRRPNCLPPFLSIVSRALIGFESGTSAFACLCLSSRFTPLFVPFLTPYFDQLLEAWIKDPNTSADRSDRKASLHIPG